MEPMINSQEAEVQKPFYDRPYEEVEDGYIDDRGFYTSPNGSFWDDDHNCFNHFGLDKNGGTYDKFGIYQPGANYNPVTGLYEDEDMKFDNISKEKNFDEKKFEENKIAKLSNGQRKDEKTVKNFAELIESENESDDEENEADKSNISYDINDIEEAMGLVMEIENNNMNKNMTSQHA